MNQRSQKYLQFCSCCVVLTHRVKSQRDQARSVVSTLACLVISSSTMAVHLLYTDAAEFCFQWKPLTGTPDSYIHLSKGISKLAHPKLNSGFSP